MNINLEMSIPDTYKIIELIHLKSNEKIHIEDDSILTGLSQYSRIPFIYEYIEYVAGKKFSFDKIYNDIMIMIFGG